MEKVVQRLLDRESRGISRRSGGKGGVLEDVINRQAFRPSQEGENTKKIGNHYLSLSQEAKVQAHHVETTVEDGGEKDEDQWDGDDDLGFLAIKLSVEDFATIEQAAGDLEAPRVEKDARDQVSIKQDTHSFAHHNEHIQLIGRTAASKKEKEDKKKKAQRAELETLHLPVIRPRNKTGLESMKDFVPRPGKRIAGKYLISRFIAESQFSFACECRTEDGSRVCAKIIKNDNKTVGLPKNPARRRKSTVILTLQIH